MIVTIEATVLSGPDGTVYQLQNGNDYLPYKFKSEDEAIAWLKNNGARPTRQKPKSGLDAMYGPTARKWVLPLPKAVGGSRDP